MTATADFMNADATAPALEPVRIADGGRMVVRAAQRLTGAALVIAALGLWLAPGASWENDLMLFKLILSITAGLAGLGLMQSSAKPNRPQIEIDTIRREVRLVRVVRDGKKLILQRCGFSELSRAEQKGHYVRLWDSNNILLAEVSLADQNTMTGLMAGLRAAGKIA